MSTTSSKPKGSNTPFACRRTASCRSGSAICSNARFAPIACKLLLSGQKLVETAPGDRQGRIASGRTLSARRTHRHQHVESRRECGRLLQQARDVRTMDQGGQRHDQMDAAVMSDVCGQCGPASTSCAGLQSRQLPAHFGDAGADQGLIADEPEGETEQDRREGGEPRSLCRVSDGRGRHPSESVRRHSAADCRTSTAT
jgi:hypothetical protein